MGLCCNGEAKNEPKYPTNISKKAKDKIDKFFKIIQKIQKEGGGKGKVYISEKKFEKFLKYMEVYENQSYFLSKLTKYRTDEQNISEEAFNYLEKIFSFIVGSLSEKYIGDEDLGIFENIIILSETFYYKITENHKIYLKEKLKGKPIFNDIEFWKKYSPYVIEKEIHKLIEDNKEDKGKNYREIGAFSKLIDIITNMKDFVSEKNQIKETIDELIKKYDISEQNQNILNMVLNE